MIKVKVGTMALTATREVRVPQEYAGYDETVSVEPGLYDVFAYIQWMGDLEGYRIHSLAARATGITTYAWYGNVARSHELIGRCTEVSIGLPTYGRCPHTCNSTQLNHAIEIEEWQPEAGGRMWCMQWRRGVKVCITQPAPWAGGTDEGVLEEDDK